MRRQRWTAKSHEKFHLCLEGSTTIWAFIIYQTAVFTIPMGTTSIPKDSMSLEVTTMNKIGTFQAKVTNIYYRTKTWKKPLKMTTS